MKTKLILYGLVLAGGQSSRMGHDKSQLTWGGLPLYQFMLEKLAFSEINDSFLSSNHLEEKQAIKDIIPKKRPYQWHSCRT